MKLAFLYLAQCLPAGIFTLQGPSRSKKGQIYKMRGFFSAQSHLTNCSHEEGPVVTGLVLSPAGLRTGFLKV